MLLTILRRLLRIALWFAVLSAALVLILRWVPPPGSMLMVERKVESWIDGKPIDLQRDWRPWKELPDDLKMAVIAGEDQHFAEHWGFDMAAIRQAFSHNEAGGSLRGASTISQQTAKNLFLWSGRSYLRKAFEAWFTVPAGNLLVQAAHPRGLSQQREWDDGVFGAEAAARHHFGIGAPYLSDRQASLLAAVLPNPREWSPSRPSAYVAERAAWIRQQERQLGGSDYLRQMTGR